MVIVRGPFIESCFVWFVCFFGRGEHERWRALALLALWDSFLSRFVGILPKAVDMGFHGVGRNSQRGGAMYHRPWASSLGGATKAKAKAGVLYGK